MNNGMLFVKYLKLYIKCKIMIFPKNTIYKLHSFFLIFCFCEKCPKYQAVKHHGSILRSLVTHNYDPDDISDLLGVMVPVFL